MGWAGRISLRGPKFAENLEFKGKKICGYIGVGDLVCVLGPGHTGRHNFAPRPKQHGGK